MLKIDKYRLDNLFSIINELKIAVVGDIMIDQYFWGKTNRISPEAPVPVVDIYKEEFKPGGAANVAFNIRSLNAKSFMLGVIGDDDSGKKLLLDFNKRDVDTSGLTTDIERPTTVKTRILAAGQHIIRYDNESNEDISSGIENELLEKLRKKIIDLDGIILEDYNKGVLTEDFIKKIIKLANENNTIVCVDPKLKNFQCYKGVTLFKPNLVEAEQILNRSIVTDDEIKRAGFELMDLLETKYIVITLSERGMAIFKKNNDMRIIPARTAKIANVSGAGDTVIATLTTALAAGAELDEACTLANFAASVVVEDVSIIPITRDSLYTRLLEADVVISS